MSADLPPHEDGYEHILIFDDPTPSAIIQNRIVRPAEISVKFTDMSSSEIDDFRNLVFLIGRKMSSVWRHMAAYRAEEERLRVKYADPNVRHREYSEILYDEYDVFAVQIKSTLDHLVQILRPVFGNHWSVSFPDRRGRSETLPEVVPDAEHRKAGPTGVLPFDFLNQVDRRVHRLVDF